MLTRVKRKNFRTFRRSRLKRMTKLQLSVIYKQHERVGNAFLFSEETFMSFTKDRQLELILGGKDEVELEKVSYSRPGTRVLGKPWDGHSKI
tara:strand:+ start:5691 stop:5966 length:276 start_codon:yes stop_codon:yes gene_type:complete